MQRKYSGGEVTRQARIELSDKVHTHDAQAPASYLAYFSFEDQHTKVPA